MKSLKRFRCTIAALAAIALVAAIRLFSGGDTVERDGLTYAAGNLAEALATERTPGLRVLTRFEDTEGNSCRAFVASGVSGIACNERGGWHLRVIRPGVSLDDPGEIAGTERALIAASERMQRQ